MTAEKLIQAYRTMSLIRAFEERLHQLFAEGIVAGTTHLCIGQEACAVGVCMALDDRDVVFSNHRGHGHLLARGADPARVMAEIFGAPHGYAGGRGGSQHMAIREIGFLGTHGITAGTIPLAVGAALQFKRSRTPAAAVVFFGDGAVGEGVFHESLNMAAIWKLPVIFACENNLYAMSSPHQEFSPVGDIADRAAAYGIAGVLVDGNDVRQVHRETAAWRTRIAEEPQPVLIELKTYRHCGHSRSDQREYRSRDEEAQWRTWDPLPRAARQLRGADRWSDADQDALDSDLRAVIAAAEQTARTPDPGAPADG